jgi:ABC-2 type transport system ATP-binding protein
MAEGHSITAVGVTKRYASRLVLDDVSLEVLRGERVCLLGSNGSGKSTLIDILAGARRPTHGQVLVFDRPANDSSVKRRRGVQIERPRFPHYARVGDIVWLFKKFHDEPLDAFALLQRFSVTSTTLVRHLSKGQQQVLGVVLAMIGQPELLILDEPTSGLDPAARARLWEIVEAHTDGAPARSLLFSTHDMSEADKAERVIILRDGRVAASGSPIELRQDWVGAPSKVTVRPGPGRLPAPLSHIPSDCVRSVAKVGAEWAIYTNDPQQTVAQLSLDDFVQVRVEPVSLEDVLIRINEGTRHETAVNAR